MRVIQTHAEVGEDRVLRIPLPEDTPMGPADVLVVLEVQGGRPDLEKRRAAARAGRGSLRHTDLSTEAFLTERSAEETRRERFLGE